MTERILVVEDNEDNIRLIDYLLKAHGYSPLLARDGSEGVRLAIENRPQMVLLDIRMPGMNGYEVATALKAEPELAGTRVVAVTASAMVGDREQIAAAGFDGYIQKPIDPETFIAQVERWLPAQAPQQQAPTAPGAASILVLDDRPVERELLEVVLCSAGHAVLQASNGEDGLAVARTEHPDLIIVDVLMPGMDGYEFVRALREDPATAATRVIMCTATYDEHEARRLALACGVAHLLIKPVEPPELLRAVAATLSEETRPIRLEPAERFGRKQLRAANAKLIEKVAALERAEEVRQLLAAIVESSDDAIIAKTLDGTIVSWNHGAEELYGYTAQEALGKPIAMLIPPERPDDLPAIMAQIKRGEVAHRLETARVRKDGTTIDVALTISPIYGDAGKLTGAATIARDVSVRKQAERELALAHRTAVETARAKSEFVTNMSHQIRTPLNGVVGMTRLLADTALDQLQHEYVAALEASNKALLLVADEVLDFAKLEAGHVELDPTRFDCRSAIEEALLMLARSVQAKGLQISHRVEDDVPATVRGDRTRLRQVLLNLLSNAVKFTAAGEVLLHVAVDDGELLRFTVSDTGVGIDEGSVESLFEAFGQADQSSSRRYGGTGLGLSISREIVARMGGQMGAENREERGARFWFTAELPAASMTDGLPDPASPSQPGAATTEATEAATREPAPDGPLVLLAEDDPTNRSVAAALLRKRGLRTHVAHHGREAVHMTRESSYDVIIMDCQLPEIDGYEATRRIHEAERPHHTPVIALTAHTQPGDRERCLGAGMDDYLAKPVEADAFYEALERWLPGGPAPAAQAAHAEHAEQPGIGQDGAEDEGLIDQEMIDQLKDTLTPEMREQLLRAFEQSLPERLADVARAARSGNDAELRRLAHLLKGSSATLGAAGLSLGFQQLEELSRERDTTVGQEQLDALEATATASCQALRRHLL
jgi:PAS domain S-box-containing protein